MQAGSLLCQYAVQSSAAAPPGGAGAFDYLLQVNTSVRYFKDEFYDPNFYYQVCLFCD